MKFACNRCGRRLATREDPIPGHVYGVACKCGHVIFFRGGEPAMPPPFPSAPPPLPWTKSRSAGVDDPPEAEALPASPPELPLLATTSMLLLDDTPIPVVLAWHAHWSFELVVRDARDGLARLLGSARDSLSEGITAWRRGRVAWTTLVVACVVSACAAASLTAWLMMVVSRPRLSTIAIRAEPAATASPAPAPAAPVPGARTAVPATRPPRQAPAAAPARPRRRAEHQAALMPEVEVSRDADADRGGGRREAPDSTRPAASTSTEPSAPAARDGAGPAQAEDVSPAPTAEAPSSEEPAPTEAASPGDGASSRSE